MGGLYISWGQDWDLKGRGGKGREGGEGSCGCITSF